MPKHRKACRSTLELVLQSAWYYLSAFFFSPRSRARITPSLASFAGANHPQAKSSLLPARKPHPRTSRSAVRSLTIPCPDGNPRNASENETTDPPRSTSEHRQSTQDATKDQPPNATHPPPYPKSSASLRSSHPSNEQQYDDTQDANPSSLNFLQLHNPQSTNTNNSYDRMKIYATTFSQYPKKHSEPAPPQKTRLKAKYALCSTNPQHAQRKIPHKREIPKQYLPNRRKKPQPPCPR